MPTALVTGSSRGIGLAIADMFSKNFYNVILTGTSLDQVLKAKDTLGSKNVSALQLDMCDPKSMETFQQNIKNLDIDVVVHNAGMLSLQNWETISTRRLEQMFRVNTLGPMLITKSILPSMIAKNKGHILFFSPPYRIDNKISFIGPYMQTKLAQTTLMHSLAYRLKNTRIGVNSFWTKFPIYTDAISHRNVGRKEECMSPNIIAEMIERMVLLEDPSTFSGKEILDADYLRDVSAYKLGTQTRNLDSLFLDFLTKK